MNVTSSDVETAEYKVLGAKSDKLVNAWKQVGLPCFSEFAKHLKEEAIIKCDDVHQELLKYIELNKTELDYMMIKKLKIVYQI